MDFGWCLELHADYDNERGVTGVTLLQDSANGGVCLWRRFVIIQSSYPTKTQETMELEVSFVIQPCLESTWCSDWVQLPNGGLMKEEVIWARANEGVLLHIIALYLACLDLVV